MQARNDSCGVKRFYYTISVSVWRFSIPRFSHEFESFSRMSKGAVPHSQPHKNTFVPSPMISVMMLRELTIGQCKFSHCNLESRATNAQRPEKKSTQVLWKPFFELRFSYQVLGKLSARLCDLSIRFRSIFGIVAYQSIQSKTNSAFISRLPVLYD